MSETQLSNVINRTIKRVLKENYDFYDSEPDPNEYIIESVINGNHKQARDYFEKYVIRNGRWAVCDFFELLYSNYAEYANKVINTLRRD